MRRLVNIPETPYALYMRSRDLATEDLVEKWLDTLEAHPDAGLACGPHYRLGYYGDVIYRATSIAHPQKLLSDNPGERMFALMDGLYYSPYYGMYKTDVLKWLFNEAFMEHSPYLGLDFILMLHFAAYHKLAYNSDAIYIVRDKYKPDGTNQYLEGYKNIYNLSENERKHPYNRLGMELQKFLEKHLILQPDEKAYYTNKLKKVFAQKSKDLNFTCW